ncbi:cutinase-domain-containing protein [Trichodelitschia bisporula]|uniref:Cutinase n=1 Tax=Trichodelitschia bisporula TaxID=703511 RepID=A0A6G1HNA7_9PEZI|nr:cutinase-domain-containing protein [Trichodelitschia bisporula]
MKFLIPSLVLAGLAAAQSCVTSPPKGMQKEPCNKPEDCNYCYLTMQDLKTGPCKAITWIFARASTELGNMGASVGTLIAINLNQTYGAANVAVQGVDYPAALMDNVGGQGCAAKGISGAVELFNMASTKCPNTIVVAGGYSQGTACMHAAIPQLKENVRQQIAAVVLFGDTRAKQTGRTIKGLDASKYKIFCNNDTDAVCKGTLSITQAHFGYAPFVPEATAFLKERIAAAKGGSSISSAEGAASAPAPKAPKAPKAASPKASPKSMGGAMEGDGHSHGHSG